MQVEGTLLYEQAMSPLPWVAAGVGRRRAAGVARPQARPSAAPRRTLLVVGISATVVGRADFSSNPGGGNPLMWMLPAVGVIAAAGRARCARTRAPGSSASWPSVATLSSWALLRYKVLLKPVLPTHFALGLDRATVAVAFGVAVASAYLAVTSGGLRLPELEDD